ncbi:MAG: helix-turn-helix transcriptional regulator [Lachnospiraceae bacterium]|nr:helix-turn-helix transcriptional regulator [Lachnospiraceae bacterium]
MEDLNYIFIGDRIRECRKERNLTQACLARMAGITPTHLSHIETGCTKLSLPVFVRIAKVLKVPADLLLYEAPLEGGAVRESIQRMIGEASVGELNVVYDVLRTTVDSLGQNVGNYRIEPEKGQ